MLTASPNLLINFIKECLSSDYAIDISIHLIIKNNKNNYSVDMNKIDIFFPQIKNKTKKHQIKEYVIRITSLDK